jgi:hypothetical protein
MKRTLLLFGVSALLFSSLNATAGLVYVDDTAGNLYKGDPAAGLAFTLVGNSGVAGGLSDIDSTSNGTLYGLDDNGLLYTVNTANAALTLVGNTGIGNDELVGLAGDGSGNLYAGGNSRIVSINTTTGLATQIGAGGGVYDVAGDLEFVGGSLYLTSSDTATGGRLWFVSTVNGIGTPIGETGFNAVWGLAEDTDNGVFYGYNAAGEEFSINTTTGVGTDIGAITGTDIGANGVGLLGAAFITAAPEPSTFASLGIAFAAIALLAVRSRRGAARPNPADGA